MAQQYLRLMVAFIPNFILLLSNNHLNVNYNNPPHGVHMIDRVNPWSAIINYVKW
jgi:hypothetical protein